MDQDESSRILFGNMQWQQDVLAVPLDAVRTDKPAPYLQILKEGRVAYAEV